MSKSMEKVSPDKGESSKCVQKLDTTNPNHLKFKHEDVFFEVLGGINIESYTMLRVMLVVRANRLTERDHVDLYNSYQLSNTIKKVSERSGYSIKYVSDAFSALTDELVIYKQQLIENQSIKLVDRYQLTDDEYRLATDFLKQSNLLNKVNDLIGTTGIIGNDTNRILLFLVYLSRFRETPLHALVHSKYNYLQRKVGELIPTEHKRTIRHISENALFYFDENELIGKLLLIEDTGTNRANLLPLIDFQIGGELVKTVTQKDKYGVLRTVQKVVKGAVCSSISTPKIHSFRNNAVVSFEINDDNSVSQDELMMNYQRRQSAGKVNKLEEQRAVELLWNMQRVMEPLRVINPFAESLILPDELKHKQITNAHYLAFIEMVTFLHQFQREQKADEQTGEIYIETTIEDIERANQLLGMILTNRCDELNKGTRIYFEKLKSYLKKNAKATFTNGDAQLNLGIPISTIKRYNSILVSKELISPTGEGNRAIGYEYQIANQNEYAELQNNVATTLTNSLGTIKHLTISSPSPKVAQKQFGLSKSKAGKTSKKVAQNSSETDESNEIRLAV